MVKRIAYVTPEIAFLRKGHMFDTYSGGLGVLASAYSCGMHDLREELGTEVVTIATNPSRGYYTQGVCGDRMTVSEGTHRFQGDVRGKVHVPIAGNMVGTQVETMSSNDSGMADAVMLSTDIDGNREEDRDASRYLYGGWREVGVNAERKIAQTMALGFGAHEATRKLDFHPDIWHGNDCHAVFTFFALLKEEIKKGSSFNEALQTVRSKCVYTTHTSVPAGNWEFPMDLMRRMVADPIIEHALHLGEKTPGMFNYAVACLRMAGKGKVNGVARKHMEISKQLWRGVSEAEDIGYVTNGSDVAYWQHEDFAKARSLPEIAAAKKNHAMKLLAYIKERTGKDLDPNLPNLTWARRFAGYKRPGLLFEHANEWLMRRLHGSWDGCFNYVIAGKPHPDDRDQHGHKGMVPLWNHLYGLSKTTPNLVVLPGYNMQMSKELKEGTYFWANSPEVGREASGTSGESAAMNCAVNISTLDGWMPEANRENFIAFGSAEDHDGSEARSKKDAASFVEEFGDSLERLRQQPMGHWETARNARNEAVQKWSAHRMARDYARKMYN